MRVLLIICLLIPYLNAHAASFDISSYENTNQLVWDSKFQKHIQEFFGDNKFLYFWNNATVAEQVQAGFSGPPQKLTLVKENTYLASACRQHSCDEKSAYISNDKYELFGVISYQCSDSVGKVSFCNDGQLVVFYKNQHAIEALSNYLVRWKNKYAPKAKVVHVNRI